LSLDPTPYLSADTLDDLMRDVFEDLLANGRSVEATKGKTLERLGMQLELRAPRARLSRSETRGRLFSSLGELCWYLSQDNRADFITYYIPAYARFAEDGIIPGGYGPRLFARRTEPSNQIGFLISLLRKKRSSRRAVAQLFDITDLQPEHKDVPCTCTIQFLVRDEKLHAVVSMRSNDAFLGLPHDVFCFTMLQELVARSLGVELGIYRHNVASLHVYERDQQQIKGFLREGWQSTSAMPPMPEGDPWEAIEGLRMAENAIRCGRALPASASTLDGYWKDLVVLLQIFRALKKTKPPDLATANNLRGTLGDDTYRLYVDERIRKIGAGVSKTNKGEQRCTLR
jgi:thymidylate synthase